MHETTTNKSRELLKRIDKPLATMSGLFAFVHLCPLSLLHVKGSIFPLLLASAKIFMAQFVVLRTPVGMQWAIYFVAVHFLGR
jgi:hypothetical protein